eukprot:CAMPEP_0119414720 /NCGR_PEP_ID=MMETSP1335-20130426/7142_1 /TAXON_ID=259385 /ORGANISM="Chrysoculter rhomboideus, Strain RCC1486" /LENGTH=39 /DNA_ID= /DNA_START= /DNA_END= /DNA_ORIENTATION=
MCQCSRLISIVNPASGREGQMVERGAVAEPRPQDIRALV